MKKILALVLLLAGGATALTACALANEPRELEERHSIATSIEVAWRLGGVRKRATVSTGITPMDACLPVRRPRSAPPRNRGSTPSNKL